MTQKTPATIHLNDGKEYFKIRVTFKDTKYPVSQFRNFVEMIEKFNGFIIELPKFTYKRSFYANPRQAELGWIFKDGHPFHEDPAVLNEMYDVADMLFILPIQMLDDFKTTMAKITTNPLTYKGELLS